MLQNAPTSRRRLGGTAAGLAVAGVLAAGSLGPVGRAAAAQTETATPAAGGPGSPATVSVTGHGSVTTAPDTAGVTIGVDVIRPTLEEAQDEATTQATAVIGAVRDQGVADADIQTSNYSVSILRDYSENGDPTAITGFQVTNQVNVTVRDIDTIGDVLDAVVGAGANSIYNIFFFVDDQTPFQSEARRAAVDDARTRAEELADAAGLSLGRVIQISEFTAQPPVPLYAGRGGGEMAMDAGAPPIEAGVSEIAVDVSVTFELVEA